MEETVKIQLKKLKIKQDGEVEKLAKMEHSLVMIDDTLARLGQSDICWDFFQTRSKKINQIQDAKVWW